MKKTSPYNTNYSSTKSVSQSRRDNKSMTLDDLKEIYDKLPKVEDGTAWVLIPDLEGYRIYEVKESVAKQIVIQGSINSITLASVGTVFKDQ